MRKKLLGIIIAVVMLFAVSAFALIGCDNSEKVEYSVTVLSPDDQPLQGITVSWKSGSTVHGSAKTNADGKATASLAPATYDIALSGYAEGLTYTEISVGSAMRELTLNLEVARVKYTATVINKDGAPAQGVGVSWMNDNTIAGTATTDASGLAECELDYGDYSVTVSKLPAGNVFSGALDATGKSPAVRFELNGGTTVEYTVTFKSEGGLPFKNQPIIIFKGGTTITNGFTDENGVCKFNLPPDNYTARTTFMQNGYTVSSVNLSVTNTTAPMTAYSAVITTAAPDSTRYVVGDIIHDYSFTTPYEVDGALVTYKISKLLETKKAIIINNWGTGCSWCVKEMPDMQTMYDNYGNDIEILAVSNYQGRGDSINAINEFRERYGYTFPFMRDTNDFVTKFSITGWPYTVIIDRYGAIARIESGAIVGEDLWERLIQRYIADDYVQTFTPGDKVSESITTEVSKPDITVDADHYEKVGEAMNNTGSFPENTSVVWRAAYDEEGIIWPFILGKVDGVSENDETVLYSSNGGRADSEGKPNSMSAIYAAVTVAPGQVFTFDYYSNTQKDADVLSIIWDGKIVKQISGNSNGWQTCKLYAELTGGVHTFAMAYIKDSTGNTGKDNVYFRNVRFTDLADIDDNTDMLRGAAYGVPEEDATQFPYYADVELKADGYYHVNTAALQNSEFAGNDESPLLLVNLLNVTNWATAPISDIIYWADEQTGEYVFQMEYTINGNKRSYRDDLISYLRAATASDVPDCVPVDALLHDILVEFIKDVDKFIEENSEDNIVIVGHAKEWLELCYFYSHYGSGDPIGNPIMGLLKSTAITAELDTTITADLTRNMQPFPTVIYTFTPTEGAVYKIESLIPDKDSSQYMGQVWLYDADTDPDSALAYCGDRFVRDGSNEHNFELYRYLQAGHKYYIEVAFQMLERGELDFKITNVGQSATVLEGCSSQTYTATNEDFTEYILADAIDYKKNEADGFYYAVNADGTLGSKIYLDVKYATGLTTLSLTELVTKKNQLAVYDAPPKNLEYDMFDFRYMIAYCYGSNEDGEFIYAIENFDLTEYRDRFDRDFKDYTSIMQGYIDGADESGLVPVNDEIVEMLTLFIETRAHSISVSIVNDTPTRIVYEPALENEWLRFCWYNHTYGANA